MSYFVFDDIDSTDYDLDVFPTDSMFRAPAHQYTSLTVPGRSGSLLIDNKRFENTIRQYGIISVDHGRQNLGDFKQALASRNGYARLQDSIDSTHYYMAAYMEDYSPEFHWRTNTGKVVITFNCKPQRYLLTGESPVNLTSSGSITNPKKFASKPLLRVYGNGVLGVGSTNITIADNTNEYVDIDCEMGRAFYGATALDSKITLNTIDYPELMPGDNGISLGTGITRVVITPRWWEI